MTSFVPAAASSIFACPVNSIIRAFLYQVIFAGGLEKPSHWISTVLPKSVSIRFSGWLLNVGFM